MNILLNYLKNENIHLQKATPMKVTAIKLLLFSYLAYSTSLLKKLSYRRPKGLIKSTAFQFSNFQWNRYLATVLPISLFFSQIVICWNARLYQILILFERDIQILKKLWSVHPIPPQSHVVCITPQSQTPQCASQRWAWLWSVHHTAKLESMVCKVHHTAESYD